MSQTVMICGYGPGIGHSVARRFGAEGFSVAIAGRNRVTLEAAAAALNREGCSAAAFPVDLTDKAAVRSTVAAIQRHFGPITVLHWNPLELGAGDLMTADVGELQTLWDTSVTGLVVAAQAASSDLTTQPGAAILVTNGGAALDNPDIITSAVANGFMGMTVVRGALRKLVAVLAERLRGDGIYVGEVVVMGAVKGTKFDTGNARLEPHDIADRFWELYRQRDEVSALFPAA